LLLPRRKGIRIPGYDYSWPGAYFVTICSRDRRNLFGELNGQRLAPNALGGIVRGCWREIPTHFPHVVTDEFVLMPDHIHGVLMSSRTIRVSQAQLPESPTNGKLSRKPDFDASD
jgi:REP element-mobilizing transposase RayT